MSPSLRMATLALLAVVTAAPALAESHAESAMAEDAGSVPAGWNHAQAIEVAQELSASIQDLRVTFRRQPTDLKVGGRRARHAVIQDLRLLRDQTRHLARLLEEGKGHDETLPVFLRIQTIRRDAAENGRRAFLLEDTLAEIDRTRALLDELDGLYTDDWQYPSQTPSVAAAPPDAPEPSPTGLAAPDAPPVADP